MRACACVAPPKRNTPRAPACVLAQAGRVRRTMYERTVPTRTAAAMSLVMLLLHGGSAAAAVASSDRVIRPAGVAAPPITLSAADGIVLKIEFPPGGSAMDYSVSLDGEAWLKSGPVAMTSGGVTYTSECTDKDRCLSLSGQPTKSSGTDVSAVPVVHLCDGCANHACYRTLRSERAHDLVCAE